MTFSSLVALPSFLFKNDYFLVLFVFKNFGFTVAPSTVGVPKVDFAIVYKHEDLINAYLITFVCFGVAINKKLVAFLNSRIDCLGFG